MASRIDISVASRNVGKHASRTSRTQGMVPGVVYGPKTKPINVVTEEKVLRKYYGRKFESTIFNLKSDVEGLDQIAVLLRDIQVHPLTQRPVHVDFYAVDMSAKIRVSIGIKFDGKPAGLAEGGVLELIVRDLEVECKPNEIPESIVVDVSGLNVGDVLHVSEVQAPAGVKILSLPSLTLATVAIPKEESLTPTAAAPTDAAAAPGGAAAAPAAAGGAAPAAAAAPAAGGDKKK